MKMEWSLMTWYSYQVSRNPSPGSEVIKKQTYGQMHGHDDTISPSLFKKQDM
jgi:hypothetical protein